MGNRFVASLRKWNNPNPRQLAWIGYLFFAMLMGVAWSTPQVELISKATGLLPAAIIGAGITGLAIVFRNTRRLHKMLFQRPLYTDEMYASLDRVGRTIWMLQRVSAHA
jgi:hypothetical protein